MHLAMYFALAVSLAATWGIDDSRINAGTQLARQKDKSPSIPAIQKRLQPFIDNHEIAGVVTLVADPERTVHLDASGNAIISDGVPMTEDTIFWIASMSKPILGTLILMLQDDGKLSV